ncbi:MAG: RES family NAD+ phosphorylase [Blastomonas fulva]|uniref:RES family NAD+ phosphorylase n=1 Tax=Blastomonas fulva TaxID=1550728 RepID=UPI004034B9B3
MTPLPGALGGAELVSWRLDRDKHAATWDSGEGAFQVGGRWNSAGVRAVYCAFDPATTILEVAVHKGFNVLDTDPHTLTSLRIHDDVDIHVVNPAAVPNPNWLRPGVPGAGQQAFGDELLANHAFVAIPSVVSSQSWNLIFVATQANGLYSLVNQERFALDARLNPVKP